MNNTPNKVIRINRLFLLSLVFSVLITAITGIILLLTFRPFRYADKAAEIYKELAPSPEFTPPPTEITITDSMRKTWKELPGEAEEMARLRRMVGAVSLAPIAVTPRYINKQEIEAKTGKPLVFGGTAEFFQYCDSDDSPVTWNPTNIEASIQQREDYLIERIKRILFFILLSTFAILYLIQYIKKHKIRLVVD